MSSDISDNNSSFAKHLMQICNDSILILSSKILLPVKSYTYIIEAWHTMSWLDHCICTADAHASLDSMEIYNGLATTDHIPIVLSLNVENLPVLLLAIMQTQGSLIGLV